MSKDLMALQGQRMLTMMIMMLMLMMITLII